MAKNKAHTKYYLKDGTLVPGTTTITGELGWGKSALIAWANNLGLKGLSSAKFRDDKAEIGTLAHGLILENHGGEKFDTSDYSKNQIDSAENSVISYYEWLKGKKLEPILVEKPLISEQHKFGGTPDNYCKLDGISTLLDYKTGKGIYLEHWIQVAGGYNLLLLETGHQVEQIMILNIPRTEDESFQQKVINANQAEICEKIFLKCLDIYNLHKQLKD